MYKYCCSLFSGHGVYTVMTVQSNKKQVQEDCRAKAKVKFEAKVRTGTT